MYLNLWLNIIDKIIQNGKKYLKNDIVKICVVHLQKYIDIYLAKGWRSALKANNYSLIKLNKTNLI